MGLAQTYMQRSPRFRSYPERFPSYVRYTESAGSAESRAAQFVDISLSGMQVVSRHPTTAQVGDLVSLEFTLPGAKRTIRNLAQVVRKKSEFVFAVRFLSSVDRGELQKAIEEYAAFVRRTALFGSMITMAKWVREHQQGLLASFLGVIVIGGAGLWIYLGSDEYNGRGLRSWGQGIPKEWFSGYHGKNVRPHK